MSDAGGSYGRILRSSSIVGGAQVANYVISLARSKIVAVLLGPAGIGLIGLYSSAIGMVGLVCSLGVSTSAVREIVRAYSKGDTATAVRTVIVLRRVCWATGLLSWAIVFLFREQLSLLMTGTASHATAIGLVGATLLLGSINSGQLALLQGMRRIGDLARANVLSALVGSILAIAIYLRWGVDGIAPAMIAVALASLGSSFLFARRLVTESVAINLVETWRGFGGLARLGAAMMWGGVLLAALDMGIRSFVVRKFGVEAAGLYQAAWALSGIFADFVLSAMGADFYPRLTGVIHDKTLASRAINEQTEIGVLLALPGLLAMLAFAPIAIDMLYTQRFAGAADLLPWFGLGVFGRVVAWPMGFVQLALGASRWFAATETIFVLFQALATFMLVERFGVIGVSYAFAATYALYISAMLWVTRTLIGFSWSAEARNLIIIATLFILLVFAVRSVPSEPIAMILGGCLTLAGGVFSLRELVARLGDDSSWLAWVRTMPGIRWVLERRCSW